MDILELTMVSLAAARLTRMAIYESGPYDFFGHIRWTVGADEKFLKGSMAELFNCPWCMSFWFVLVLFACKWICPYLTMILCVILSVSFTSGAAIKLTSDDEV